MKLTMNLAALAMFSIFFISCSDTVTQSGDISKSFNYSVQTVLADSVNSISAGDENTLFMTSPQKSWKMENGVLTQIDFHDPNFKAFEVKAYNKDYAIFDGISIPGYARSFKIYDTGNIRTIGIPFNINGGTVFIINRNKFLSGGLTSNKYRIYTDSSFTEYTLPDSAQAGWTGYVNNDIYMFAINLQTYNSYYVYKITDSGPVKIREEAANYAIRTLNQKDIIKLVEEQNRHTFYSYTEQGWKQMFFYETLNQMEYVYYIAGPSKDFFLELSVAENKSGGPHYIPGVWNGAQLYPQNNFPESDFPASYSVQTFVSEYRNNAFYMFRNNDASGGKLLKATLNR